MSRKHTPRETVYAIVRYDFDAEEPEERVTIKTILWDRHRANTEVERLNRLSTSKKCRYFSQLTRLAPQSGSFDAMEPPSQPAERIAAQIAADLPALAPHLRQWVEMHLVAPRPLCVQSEHDGSTTRVLWLVTDDTGDNDAGYRIVYDVDASAFGLETRTAQGHSFLLGLYGPFAAAVESI
jgi:hypothetical protein